MTNQHTDEMRAQVLGQALITITRQEYECLKMTTTRYESALREARDTIIAMRTGRAFVTPYSGDEALTTINKLLGDK